MSATTHCPKCKLLLLTSESACPECGHSMHKPVAAHKGLVATLASIVLTIINN